MVKDFKDLEVWRTGQNMALQIYKLTKTFPQDEIFGLSSQMRRCAVSVPSNISEGFNRLHQKEFKRFLSMDLGSLAELETQINIGYELKYIKEDNYLDLNTTIIREAKMIRSLIQKLKIVKPAPRTQTPEPRTHIPLPT